MKALSIASLILLVAYLGLVCGSPSIQDQINNAIGSGATSLTITDCNGSTRCTGVGNVNIQLNASSSTLMSIYASGITIDCGGFSNASGLALSIVSRPYAPLYIFGLTIANCSLPTAAAVYVRDVEVSFFGTSFYSNPFGAVTVTGASPAKFDGCNFFANGGRNLQYGGALYVDSSSPVLVQDCLFTANSASQYGGSIFAKSSLMVLSSTFRIDVKTLSSYSGGYIYSQSSLEVTNSSFVGGTGSHFGSAIAVAPGPADSVTIRRTSILATGQSSPAVYGGGMYIAGSGPVFLEDVDLSSHQTTSGFGAAIYAVNGRIEARRSNFTKNNRFAVYIISGAATVFDSCLFADNGCDTGGCALYYQSSAIGYSASDSLRIVRSTFRGHKPVSSTSKGGAIHHAGSALNITACTFEKNSAFYGASFYYGLLSGSSTSFAGFTIEKNIFRNNTATGLGSAVYVEALPFGFKNLAASNVVSDSVGPAVGSLPRPDSPVVIQNPPLTVFPGTQLLLSAYLMDSFNNIIPSDSSNFYVIQVTMDTGSPCALPGATVFDPSGDIFMTHGLIVSGPLGSKCQLTFQVPGRKSSRMGFYIAPRCQEGFFYTSGGVCQQCARGTYNLDGVSGCKDCPEGATCPGGTAVLSKKNFYVNIEGNSAVAYSCDLETCAFESPCTSTCLENNACSTGYAGIVCGSCADGYIKMNGNCVKCSGSSANGGIVVFILVYVTALIALLLTLHPGSFSFLKIFIDFFQTCIVLVNFSYMNIASFDFSLFGSCLFDTCVSSEMKFKEAFLVSIFSPLLWLAVMVIAYPAYVLYLVWMQRRHQGDVAYEDFDWKSVARASALQTLWFLLLFLHTPVSITVLNFFALRKIGNDSYVATDASVSSKDSQYTSLEPLAILLIIFWVVCLPMALIAFAYFIHERLIMSRGNNQMVSNAAGNEISTKPSAAVADTPFLKATQFFFLTYHKSWSFWDVVLLLRRLFLVVLTRRWNNYPLAVALLLAVFLNVSFMFAHMFTKPFVQRRVNKVASLSLLCLVLVSVIYAEIPVIDRLDDSRNAPSTLAFRVIISLCFIGWILMFLGWVGAKVRKYWNTPPGSFREKMVLTGGQGQYNSQLLAGTDDSRQA